MMPGKNYVPRCTKLNIQSTGCSILLLPGAWHSNIVHPEVCTSTTILWWAEKLVFKQVVYYSLFIAAHGGVQSIPEEQV